MSKPLSGILFFVFTFMFFQNCNNITDPVISKNDLTGTWHEVDTSTGSEIWLFSDSTVIHGFKNLDTMGQYSTWIISSNTIILTDNQNNNDNLTFTKLENGNLNLKYYRWSTFIDKNFIKNE